MVTGFTKLLGDQQLITGLAILIAGLAGRCGITLFEFNIVTNLAYFATFTHTLSLQVARDYLYEHTFVRFWHVSFTLCSFVLFAFSYCINTVNWDSLNQASILQCVFEASSFSKHVEFSTFDCIIVLGTLAWNLYVSLRNLYLPRDTDAVTNILERMMSRHLRTTGLSDDDRWDIITNSRFKYYIWLQPPRSANNSAKISPWYYLQVYLDSFLSSIPTISLGLIYGTTSTVYAVWPGAVGETADLGILGFGQVVALGLLLLTLLSTIEMFNGKCVSCTGTSGQSGSDNTISAEQRILVPDTTKPVDDAKSDEVDDDEACDPFSQPKSRRAMQGEPKTLEWLERLVLHGCTRSRRELHALATVTSSLEDPQDNPITARRLAKFCCIVWAVHVSCYTVIGVLWNFPDTNFVIAGLLSFWVMFRVCLGAKRILNQVYFVLREARQRVHETNLASADQQASISNQSKLSVFDPDSYGPPQRLGTEPDIGLFSRRQTYVVKQL